MSKLNLAGAGEWYTEITGTSVELNGGGGNDNIHDLSLFGTVNVRNDGDGLVNGLNGKLSASGYTQNYAPTNANDGNTSSYWESVNKSRSGRSSGDSGDDDRMNAR